MPPTKRRAVGDDRKDSSPAVSAPAELETDTSGPSEEIGSDEGSATASTPIHDQIQKDLSDADPADVTQFEEDDNPLEHVGELTDEPDDTPNEKENS